MSKVPDTITLGELCRKAAQALAKHGMDRRIDIYREIEIDDPAIRLMLGRSHRVRVRVKITATSLLFEGENTLEPEIGSTMLGAEDPLSKF